MKKLFELSVEEKEEIKMLNRRNVEQYGYPEEYDYGDETYMERLKQAEIFFKVHCRKERPHSCSNCPVKLFGLGEEECCYCEVYLQGLKNWWRECK